MTPTQRITEIKARACDLDQEVYRKDVLVLLAHIEKLEAVVEAARTYAHGSYESDQEDGNRVIDSVRALDQEDSDET